MKEFDMMDWNSTTTTTTRRKGMNHHKHEYLPELTKIPAAQGNTLFSRVASVETVCAALGRQAGRGGAGEGCGAEGSVCMVMVTACSYTHRITGASTSYNCNSNTFLPQGSTRSCKWLSRGRDASLLLEVACDWRRSLWLRVNTGSSQSFPAHYRVTSVLGLFCDVTWLYTIDSSRDSKETEVRNDKTARENFALNNNPRMCVTWITFSR